MTTQNTTEFCVSEDAEYFNTTIEAFSYEEAARKYANDNDVEVGGTIYVGIGKQLDVVQHFPDLDLLLERAEESFYEMVGDVSENYASSINGDKFKEIEASYKKWVADNIPQPSFYTVGKIESFVVEESWLEKGATS